MESTKKTLSLVIPCLNEEEAIPGVIEKCLLLKEKLLKEGKVKFFEIIVVDDGSTDKSLSLLQSLENSGSIRLIKNDSLVHGYGSALKKGLSSSISDYLCMFDMDETYPPRYLEDMLESLDNEPVEAVVGVRQHTDSGMPKIRSLGNGFYKILVNSLYSGRASDPCSGMWMMKSEMFKQWSSQLPDSLDFTLTFTIFMLKNKIAFKEIPIDYLERAGDSKLSVFTDGPLFLKTILKHRIF